MFHAQKNNAASNWRPSASLKYLQARAEILQKLRTFFAERNILEVETPLLCHTSVTDPFIHSLMVSGEFYLQTSPEYAMKRLLAAGSGAIYQICKAFRQDEAGRWHNPEFTILEWYRPGFDQHALMDEMDALLQQILNVGAAIRQAYASVFQDFLGVNPHEISLQALKILAKEQGLNVEGEIQDKDTWLQLLLSHSIEPHLGKDKPFFIYDFPASQAALARLDPHNPAVASRFEVYYQGIELANGFHELQDATMQRERFEKNLAARAELNFPLVPIDEYLLAALEHGLPDCAGVALGIDRLVMLALGRETIADVLSFEFSRA